MSFTFVDTFKVIILISSLQGYREYGAINSPIHTMREEASSSDYVSTIVVEEYKPIYQESNLWLKRAN